jgi:hypothetical protein
VVLLCCPPSTFSLQTEFLAAGSEMAMEQIGYGLAAFAAGALVSGLVGTPLRGQAVKPQLSALPDSVMPRGCSYTVDDWRGTLLLWAPYSAFHSNSEQPELLIAVDGVVRRLAISSRSNDHITAYDGTYQVDLRTPSWNRVGIELSQARATLILRNTRAYTETRLIVRASEGC